MSAKSARLKRPQRRMVRHGTGGDGEVDFSITWPPHLPVGIGGNF
jgi:hypothetical protein